MSERLTVSVVVATYNRPQSLSACLTSLEGQTLSPLEVVVVVDGGQVDEALEVIDAFKDRRRLNISHLVNEENRGAPFSKNRGAELARGDIVAFVDDDITLIPEWMAEIVKGYGENENAVAVGGRCVMSRQLYSSRLYDISIAVRRCLFGGRLGKMSFIGVPYLALVFPTDGYVTSDFLHGGLLTVVRESFLATQLDQTMGVRDEYDLCIRLRKNTGGTLIYNPRAVAHHNVTATGGFGAWGHERACLDVQDHIPYLMKNYNFRYLRLATFCALILAYSLVTLKPMFLKALWEGLKRYRRWSRSQRQAAALAQGN